MRRMRMIFTTNLCNICKTVKRRRLSCALDRKRSAVFAFYIELDCEFETRYLPLRNCYSQARLAISDQVNHRDQDAAQYVLIGLQLSVFYICENLY